MPTIRSKLLPSIFSAEIIEFDAPGELPIIISSRPVKLFSSVVRHSLAFVSFTMHYIMTFRTRIVLLEVGVLLLRLFSDYKFGPTKAKTRASHQSRKHRYTISLLTCAFDKPNRQVSA